MTTLPRDRSSARRRLFVTVLAASCTIAGTASLERPIRAVDLPRDASAVRFLDRSGLPLGTILGRDDRHTVAVPLARIAPSFLQAVVATEDRRFVTHGAIDPLAALRALRDGILEARVPHGASTISMQLARSIAPPAPPWLPTPLARVEEKLAEFVIARRLENGLSKAQILEAYANRAPMGSNLYGVEAAARTYFATPAAGLDLAQAATLAALPNDPVRLDPYRHADALAARRELVLERMRVAGFIDADAQRRATSERVRFVPRGGGIVAAAHFLFALAPSIDPATTTVRTTIDRPLQRFCEAQVRAVLATLGASHVRDAAVLVLDNATGEILAYVGSPDYFDDANLGRNDGVRALRQPGSALKPFLYELALERRAIRPNTILADVPTTYALPDARVYAPTDYSHRFLGPVRVRIALANSLNVPAVRVLEGVGVPAFLARLHELGFAHLDRPADYYGLGLTLGGGEVSLEELTRAYAGLARDGDLPATVARLGTTSVTSPYEGEGDPAWALVTDMLADPDARAAAFGVDSILALPFPAAVKTGTSSDYRDTWTVGFTRRFTVGVWVGNFDGSPMRGVSGVTGAGPLWNRIMLHLHENDEPERFAAPRGYARTRICALTGGAVDAACPDPVEEYLDRGDVASLRAAPAGGADAARALGPAYDAWLIDQAARDSVGTRILFPRDGDVFVRHAEWRGAQRLKFEIAHARGRALRVRVDGTPLAREQGDYLWTLALGRHELVASDDAPSRAASDRVVFEVIAATPRTEHVGFSVGPAARRP